MNRFACRKPFALRLAFAAVCLLIGSAGMLSVTYASPFLPPQPQNVTLPDDSRSLDIKSLLTGQSLARYRMTISKSVELRLFFSSVGPAEMGFQIVGPDHVPLYISPVTSKNRSFDGLLTRTGVYEIDIIPAIRSDPSQKQFIPFEMSISTR